MFGNKHKPSDGDQLPNRQFHSRQSPCHSCPAIHPAEGLLRAILTADVSISLRVRGEQDSMLFRNTFPVGHFSGRPPADSTPARQGVRLARLLHMHLLRVEICQSWRTGKRSNLGRVSKFSTSVAGTTEVCTVLATPIFQRLRLEVLNPLECSTPTLLAPNISIQPVVQDPLISRPPPIR